MHPHSLFLDQLASRCTGTDIARHTRAREVTKVLARSSVRLLLDCNLTRPRALRLPGMTLSPSIRTHLRDMKRDICERAHNIQIQRQPWPSQQAPGCGCDGGARHSVSRCFSMKVPRWNIDGENYDIIGNGFQVNGFFHNSFERVVTSLVLNLHLVPNSKRQGRGSSAWMPQAWEFKFSQTEISANGGNLRFKIL